MRRLLVRSYALSMALLTACGSDSAVAPTKANITGSWNLQTINGAPLPYVAQPSDPKIEIMSDQIVATAAGRFTRTIGVRLTDSTGVSTDNVTDGGSYVVTESTAVFTFNDGSKGTAVLGGDIFTVSEAGFEWIYRRQ